MNHASASYTPELPIRPNRLLFAIFDTDQDQLLSAEEIEQASEALWKLDRNQDGTLTTDEAAEWARLNVGGGGMPGQRGGPPPWFDGGGRDGKHGPPHGVPPSGQDGVGPPGPPHEKDKVDATADSPASTEPD